MADEMFPETTPELAKRKANAAPEIIDAWRAFSRAVFKPGALDAKTKQLMAIAVAHVTQCPYCIRAHTDGALKAGASEAEIMEAVWIAAEMRAGAAYAHGTIAMDEIVKHSHGPDDGTPKP
jgi:AhpD family alkylhydroperoxidase